MHATAEDILDLLSTLIMDLGSIRDQTTDHEDRAAVNEQIVLLTGWWRKIDNIRAHEPNEALNDAKSSLESITKDLKQEKKKLENIAKVIAGAAHAAAIAEKAAKLLA
ncbi:MAG: hypothetical protein ACU84J_14160 [Gammaproteobacteria bacterium]